MVVLNYYLGRRLSRSLKVIGWIGKLKSILEEANGKGLRYCYNENDGHLVTGIECKARELLSLFSLYSSKRLDYHQRCYQDLVFCHHNTSFVPFIHMCSVMIQIQKSQPLCHEGTMMHLFSALPFFTSLSPYNYYNLLYVDYLRDLTTLNWCY